MSRELPYGVYMVMLECIEKCNDKNELLEMKRKLLEFDESGGRRTNIEKEIEKALVKIR